jgi:branched-chain amino acid transport system permease protein
LPGIPVPTFFGYQLTDNGLYLFALVLTALWFALMRNLILSPHGNAFLVLKQSPILASALGISVYRLKLLAYVMGAVPCGMAGVLFAFLSGYLSPDSFTFALAISVLAASVVGGSQSIYGAIFGAALLQLGPERISSFQGYSLVVYGAFLIVAGILFSQGVAGLIHQGAGQLRRRHLLPRPLIAPARHAEPPAGEVLALPELHGETLSVEGARKSFGGNVAVDDVTVEARPGEVTALIGPNGSGKTTLLNLVCGYYRMDGGRIRLGDADLTSLSVYRTARAGVARTFQTPLIPQGMSTRDFVVTGRYVSHRIRLASAMLRLPAYWRRTRANDVEAVQIMRQLGIEDTADQTVSSLPLGTRRLAEVARSLAAEPKVFLFDEVGSGLDEGDIARLEEALSMIRRAGGTIVLVEHNFPLVLRVADRIHVLSNGALLASGTPEEIQNDPRVLEEYTGAVDDQETLAQLEELAAGPDGETPAGAPR